MYISLLSLLLVRKCRRSEVKGREKEGSSPRERIKICTASLLSQSQPNSFFDSARCAVSFSGHTITKKENEYFTTGWLPRKNEQTMVL